MSSKKTPDLKPSQILDDILEERRTSDLQTGVETSHLEPGLYRGGSPIMFGLWYLNCRGQWLFSMPLRGQEWRPAALGLDELEKLTFIYHATGSLTEPDSELRKD